MMKRIKVIRAPVRVDKRTKRLLQRLKRGEVAVIDHEDIDLVAAQALWEAGVRAVVNVSRSVSGEYPAEGAAFLLAHGIPVIDEVDSAALELLRDGDWVQLDVATGIICKDSVTLRGKPLTPEEVKRQQRAAEGRLKEVLEKFVRNTLEYVRREGVELLTTTLVPPALCTRVSGRHALVVARGRGYKEDLRAIASYIRGQRPVLIGVDGGADALLELGFKPDIIIGDMDSVSEAALRQATDIVVHAYPDGYAPGLERIKSLGVDAHTFPLRGTSEDAAMLLAYVAGARLIVAVGTHTNLMDFLEKGRAGMASTFLTRLRVGHLLVDAKGVSQLYSGKLKLWHMLGLVALGAIIAWVILRMSPHTLRFLHTMWLWLVVTLEQLWRHVHVF